MINALKRLDKKFIVFAGLLIFAPITIIILLLVIQGCGDKKITPEQYESKMINSSEKYIKMENKEPNLEGELLEIDLSTLVNKNYIKSTEKLLDDSSCNGTVSVRRNGASVESTNGGYLNYTVDLKCNNYSTTHLSDKIIEDNLVTQESGLYQDEEGYIFKGDKTKNHITFFGVNYRIMSIDKNGILKLVKSEPEATTRIWDNKFNVETNRSTGKNIYKDSIIKDYLINDYESQKKVSLEARKNIVAYDVCVGKRSSADYTIDSVLDCNETLEKQVVSLMNISDYAKASLDPDCVDLRSQSCNNYNYLRGAISNTWTLNVVTENTYEVIYLSNGRMELQNANTYNTYNMVIYIDGNQIYKSGNGSSTSPYIVG